MSLVSCVCCLIGPMIKDCFDWFPTNSDVLLRQTTKRLSDAVAAMSTSETARGSATQKYELTYSDPLLVSNSYISIHLSIN